jgi:high-affinity iron transporter
MLAALIIVFREVLEAGLIVGVILAATEGLAGRRRWITGGVAGGLLGAGVIAVSAGRLSEAFAGSGQELFNAAILIIAVFMLGWHTLWMARHARELTAEMTALGRSVRSGERTLATMALVVAVAILREGSEVVLFLYGIAASGGGAPAAMLLGGLGGIGLGVALSWLIYRGLLAIPTGKLFSVTNALLSLLAAGMAGQAAVYLVKAGVIPSLGDEIWDTSAILADNSLPGRALHAIAGYSDRPMGVQLGAYLAVLALLIVLSRALGGPTPPQSS